VGWKEKEEERSDGNQSVKIDREYGEHGCEEKRKRMKGGRRKVRMSLSVSETLRTCIQKKGLRHSAVSHQEPLGQPFFTVQPPEYEARWRKPNCFEGLETFGSVRKEKSKYDWQA
jgi:hypothetical protein